jgi:hypothetical protein
LNSKIPSAENNFGDLIYISLSKLPLLRLRVRNKRTQPKKKPAGKRAESISSEACHIFCVKQGHGMLKGLFHDRYNDRPFSVELIDQLPGWSCTAAQAARIDVPDHVFRCFEPENPGRRHGQEQGR